MDFRGWLGISDFTVNEPAVPTIAVFPQVNAHVVRLSLCQVVVTDALWIFISAVWGYCDDLGMRAAFKAS
jgi:hypothetical protein